MSELESSSYKKQAILNVMNMRYNKNYYSTKGGGGRMRRLYLTVSNDILKIMSLRFYVRARFKCYWYNV